MATPTSPHYMFATAIAFSLLSLSSAVVDSQCSTAQFGDCYDKPAALRLKLVSIVSILIASTIGVSLPLLSRSVPMLRPDRNLFVVVKAFASGVILATGFMHVLPDSFEMLMSPCLPREPWHKFPFTTFIAMLSAIFTLMVESFMMTFQGRKGCAEVADHDSPLATNAPPQVIGHGHGHGHCVNMPVPLEVDSKTIDESTLLRNRIVAQVLEMGIVVHSVVIGLSMGASQNVCTIRPLVAALCFHQLFEGMGLGGCILQAEYTLKIKATMVFFFSTTTPIGIALGIGLSNIYSDSSPTALIVVGTLNASSAGLLIYMALVDLLAADFLGSRLQKSARLQGWAYVAVLLGAGGMSLMAKWA